MESERGDHAPTSQLLQEAAMNQDTGQHHLGSYEALQKHLSRMTLRRDLAHQKEEEEEDACSMIRTFAFYQRLSPRVALDRLFMWCRAPSSTTVAVGASNEREEAITLQDFNQLRRALGRSIVLDMQWERAMQEMGKSHDGVVGKSEFGLLFGPPPLFGPSNYHEMVEELLKFEEHLHYTSRLMDRFGIHLDSSATPSSASSPTSKLIGQEQFQSLLRVCGADSDFYQEEWNEMCRQLDLPSETTHLDRQQFARTMWTSINSMSPFEPYRDLESVLFAVLANDKLAALVGDEDDREFISEQSFATLLRVCNKTDDHVWSWWATRLLGRYEDSVYRRERRRNASNSKLLWSATVDEILGDEQVRKAADKPFMISRSIKDCGTMYQVLFSEYGGHTGLRLQSALGSRCVTVAAIEENSEAARVPIIDPLDVVVSVNGRTFLWDDQGVDETTVNKRLKRVHKQLQDPSRAKVVTFFRLDIYFEYSPQTGALDFVFKRYKLIADADELYLRIPDGKDWHPFRDLEVTSATFKSISASYSSADTIRITLKRHKKKRIDINSTVVLRMTGLHCGGSSCSGVVVGEASYRSLLAKMFIDWRFIDATNPWVPSGVQELQAARQLDPLAPFTIHFQPGESGIGFAKFHFSECFEVNTIEDGSQGDLLDVHKEDILLGYVMDDESQIHSTIPVPDGNCDCGTTGRIDMQCYGSGQRYQMQFLRPNAFFFISSAGIHFQFQALCVLKKNSVLVVRMPKRWPTIDLVQARCSSCIDIQETVWEAHANTLRIVFGDGVLLEKQEVNIMISGIKMPFGCLTQQYFAEITSVNKRTGEMEFQFYDNWHSCMAGNEGLPVSELTGALKRFHTTPACLWETLECACALFSMVKQPNSRYLTLKDMNQLLQTLYGPANSMSDVNWNALCLSIGANPRVGLTQLQSACCWNMVDELTMISAKDVYAVFHSASRLFKTISSLLLKEHRETQALNTVPSGSEIIGYETSRLLAEINGLGALMTRIGAEGCDFETFRQLVCTQFLEGQSADLALGIWMNFYSCEKIFTRFSDGGYMTREQMSKLWQALDVADVELAESSWKSICSRVQCENDDAAGLVWPDFMRVYLSPLNTRNALDDWILLERDNRSAKWSAAAASADSRVVVTLATSSSVPDGSAESTNSQDAFKTDFVRWYYLRNKGFLLVSIKRVVDERKESATGSRQQPKATNGINSVADDDIYLMLEIGNESKLQNKQALRSRSNQVVDQQNRHNDKADTAISRQNQSHLDRTDLEELHADVGARSEMDSLLPIQSRLSKSEESSNSTSLNGHACNDVHGPKFSSVISRNVLRDEAIRFPEGPFRLYVDTDDKQTKSQSENTTSPLLLICRLFECAHGKANQPRVEDQTQVGPSHQQSAATHPSGILIGEAFVPLASILHLLHDDDQSIEDLVSLRDETLTTVGTVTLAMQFKCAAFHDNVHRVVPNRLPWTSFALDGQNRHEISEYPAHGCLEINWKAEKLETNDRLCLVYEWNQGTATTPVFTVTWNPVRGRDDDRHDWYPPDEMCLMYDQSVDRKGIVCTEPSKSSGSILIPSSFDLNLLPGVYRFYLFRGEDAASVLWCSGLFGVMPNRNSVHACLGATTFLEVKQGSGALAIKEVVSSIRRPECSMMNPSTKDGSDLTRPLSDMKSTPLTEIFFDRMCNEQEMELARIELDALATQPLEDRHELHKSNLNKMQTLIEELQAHQFDDSRECTDELKAKSFVNDACGDQPLLVSDTPTFVYRVRDISTKNNRIMVLPERDLCFFDLLQLSLMGLLQCDNHRKLRQVTKSMAADLMEFRKLCERQLPLDEIVKFMIRHEALRTKEDHVVELGASVWHVCLQVYNQAPQEVQHRFPLILPLLIDEMHSRADELGLDYERSFHPLRIGYQRSIWISRKSNSEKPHDGQQETVYADEVECSTSLHSVFPGEERFVARYLSTMPSYRRENYKSPIVVSLYASSDKFSEICRSRPFVVRPALLHSSKNHPSKSVLLVMKIALLCAMMSVKYFLTIVSLSFNLSMLAANFRLSTDQVDIMVSNFEARLATLLGPVEVALTSIYSQISWLVGRVMDHVDLLDIAGECVNGFALHFTFVVLLVATFVVYVVVQEDVLLKVQKISRLLGVQSSKTLLGILEQFCGFLVVPIYLVMKSCMLFIARHWRLVYNRLASDPLLTLANFNLTRIETQKCSNHALIDANYGFGIVAVAMLVSYFFIGLPLLLLDLFSWESLLKPKRSNDRESLEPKQIQTDGYGDAGVVDKKSPPHSRFQRFCQQYSSMTIPEMVQEYGAASFVGMFVSVYLVLMFRSMGRALMSLLGFRGRSGYMYQRQGGMPRSRLCVDSVCWRFNLSWKSRFLQDKMITPLVNIVMVTTGVWGSAPSRDFHIEERANECYRMEPSNEIRQLNMMTLHGKIVSLFWLCIPNATVIAYLCEALNRGPVFSYFVNNEFVQAEVPETERERNPRWRLFPVNDTIRNEDTIHLVNGTYFVTTLLKWGSSLAEIGTVFAAFWYPDYQRQYYLVALLAAAVGPMLEFNQHFIKVYVDHLDDEDRYMSWVKNYFNQESHRAQCLHRESEKLAENVKPMDEINDVFSDGCDGSLVEGFRVHHPTKRGKKLITLNAHPLASTIVVTDKMDPQQGTIMVDWHVNANHRFHMFDAIGMFPVRSPTDSKERTMEDCICYRLVQESSIEPLGWRGAGRRREETAHDNNSSDCPSASHLICKLGTNGKRLSDRMAKGYHDPLSREQATRMGNAKQARRIVNGRVQFRPSNSHANPVYESFVACNNAGIYPIKFGLQQYEFCYLRYKFADNDRQEIAVSGSSKMAPSRKVIPTHISDPSSRYEILERFKSHDISVGAFNVFAEITTGQLKSNAKETVFLSWVIHGIEYSTLSDPNHLNFIGFYKYQGTDAMTLTKLQPIPPSAFQQVARLNAAVTPDTPVRGFLPVTTPDEYGFYEIRLLVNGRKCAQTSYDCQLFTTLENPMRHKRIDNTFDKHRIKEMIHEFSVQTELQTAKLNTHCWLRSVLLSWLRDLTDDGLEASSNLATIRLQDRFSDSLAAASNVIQARLDAMVRPFRTKTFAELLAQAFNVSAQMEDSLAFITFDSPTHDDQKSSQLNPLRSKFLVPSDEQLMGGPSTFLDLALNYLSQESQFGFHDLLDDLLLSDSRLLERFNQVVWEVTENCVALFEQEITNALHDLMHKAEEQHVERFLTNGQEEMLQGLCRNHLHAIFRASLQTDCRTGKRWKYSGRADLMALRMKVRTVKNLQEIPPHEMALVIAGDNNHQHPSDMRQGGGDAPVTIEYIALRKWIRPRLVHQLMRIFHRRYVKNVNGDWPILQDLVGSCFRRSIKVETMPFPAFRRGKHLSVLHFLQEKSGIQGR